MAIIDPSSPILNDDNCTFWQDELKNLKILLLEVEKGLLFLAGNKTQSYKLSTGQTDQTVQRLNFNELNTMRLDLITQIRDIELMLGIGKQGTIQVVPDF